MRLGPNGRSRGWRPRTSSASSIWQRPELTRTSTPPPPKATCARCSKRWPTCCRARRRARARRSGRPALLMTSPNNSRSDWTGSAPGAALRGPIWFPSRCAWRRTKRSWPLVRCAWCYRSIRSTIPPMSPMPRCCGPRPVPKPATDSASAPARTLRSRSEAQPRPGRCWIVSSIYGFPMRSPWTQTNCSP